MRFACKKKRNACFLLAKSKRCALFSLFLSSHQAAEDSTEYRSYDDDAIKGQYGDS